MRQITERRTSMAGSVPNLEHLRGIVADQVLEAAYEASDALRRLRIRHALVGGLAVGVYGWVRATKDVDFLVGPEGFESHGRIVTFKAGVPLRVGNVAIDPILYGEKEAHLEQALDHPHKGRPPIAPVESLIYMKLTSPRKKDQADIVELLKAGVEAGLVVRYLKRHAPALLQKFAALLNDAASEE